MTDTPRSLLELWPSRNDIVADTGTTLWVVTKWFKRERIPAEFWAPLVRSAKARGIKGVSLERLAALHARKPVRRVALVEART